MVRLGWVFVGDIFPPPEYTVLICVLFNVATQTRHIDTHAHTHAHTNTHICVCVHVRAFVACFVILYTGWAKSMYTVYVLLVHSVF